MTTIDLNKLQEKHQKFIDEREWDQFHSVKNLVMALSVEASELVEIFQWQTELQSNETKDHPDIKQKTADELADIFMYLIRVANKCQIELPQAIEEKMKKNAVKYPVDLARGKAVKYTEL